MFEVAAGEHVKNMPVRLMPAAVVTGEIVDEYNDPVQSVEVKLLAIRMRLGQMVLTQAGKPRRMIAGNTAFAGLHPGRYYLVAEYKPSNSTADAIRTSTVRSN